MPTLALLPGHTFAAGLMTAMMHDYRFMNPHKGYLCLNELDFGATLSPPMASIFRQKVPNPHTFRTMILESKRFKPLEALKEGIVDGLGGVEEALAFIGESKLADRGKSGVYGKLKREMWAETVENLDDIYASERKEKERYEKDKLRSAEEQRRVEEWSVGKPKL